MYDNWDWLMMKEPQQQIRAAVRKGHEPATEVQTDNNIINSEGIISSVYLD